MSPRKRVVNPDLETGEPKGEDRSSVHQDAVPPELNDVSESSRKREGPRKLSPVGEKIRNTRAARKLRDDKDLLENVIRVGPDTINAVTGLMVDDNNIPRVNQQVKRKRSYVQRKPEVARKVKERIEEVRLLMTLSMSVGDIVRTLTIKWNCSKSLVRKYVTLARKRQQEILQRRPEETFGDSLSYWSGKLQQAYARYRQGLADLAAAREATRQADEMTSLAIASGDGKAIIAAQKHHKVCQNRIHQARMLISGASAAADSYQDRIDRLCGNLAPDRVALVTASGQDVLTPALEPLNREQAAVALIEALQSHFPHVTEDQLRTLGLPLPKDVARLIDSRHSAGESPATAGGSPQSYASSDPLQPSPASPIPGAASSAASGAAPPPTGRSSAETLIARAVPGVSLPSENEVPDVAASTRSSSSGPVTPPSTNPGDPVPRGVTSLPPSSTKSPATIGHKLVQSAIPDIPVEVSREE